MAKRGRHTTGRLYDSFGVYIITCLKNSRIYIGGSNTVYNRICNQKCRLRNGDSACIPELLEDFKKYGENEFKFEIAHRCESRADFLRIEQALIEKFQPSGLLYNIINAYIEKTPKRRRSSKGRRFQITLPIRQRKWLEKKSYAKNLYRSFYLEILIDSMMSKERAK